MAANQDQEMWLWKFEPASPNGVLSSKADDNWLLLDDKSVDFINNAAEPVLYDDHPTRAQVATKLLEELDEWIKEEPFSDWLEEKIELPIFEELPVPDCVTPTKPNSVVGYSPGSLKLDDQESTQTLLQEFETVLGDVGACHQILPPNSSTLTPPQSPPPNPSLDTTQLLVTLQPVQSLFPQQQTVTYAPIDSQEETTLYEEQEIPSQWNAENVSLVPLGNDVTNELADVVDEFVRCYSEDVSPPSPCTSSDSCHLSEDSTDDPDWVLEQEPKAKQTSRDSAKHRYKPYSRSTVEDKKVRKKEQNKNAATRYRQKKKQEIKEIIGEERELTEHNEKLKDQVKDLQREIGYLKGLMKDLFKAKGLIE